MKTSFLFLCALASVLISLALYRARVVATGLPPLVKTS